MSFNKYQTIAAQTYAGGDFAHCESLSEAKQIGDTLFGFVMVELADSEGCDSLEEAIRRMENALDDLRGVYNALESAANEVE